MTATALLLGACSSALASTIAAAKGDASRVYFGTDEALLPADTDSTVDIYERAGGLLSLVSIGDAACRPGCGNGNFDVDLSGGLHLVSEGILFSTAESLVPADTDSAGTIYRRTEGGLELVSRGQGEFDARFDSVSRDGSTVVFTTAEQLTPGDTDSSADVYERTGGSTVLVSQGESFNGPFDAKWAVTTPDGSSVFFLTREQVLALDTDDAIDLYQRSGSTTTLISRGTVPANGEFDVGDVVMTSDDGARTVFTTSEPIFENDEDDQPDIYMRFGGTTTLVSDGSYNPHEGEFPVLLDALDPRANQVVMSSDQVLNEEDRDHTGPDVFEWYYDKTILVSQGPFQPFIQPPKTANFLRYSPGELGAVFFASDERLVSEDTDNSFDIYERQLGIPNQVNIYERSEGITKLVTQGPKNFNGPFVATLQQVTPDGNRILFTTSERLVNEDTDSSVDLYERSRAQVTRLVSAGQVNGNGPFDVTAAGDGERPMFVTSEQLVPGDEDNAPDLYERAGQRTRLLSTARPDPTAPIIAGSSPGSPSNVDQPRLTGTAPAGSAVDIYAGAECGESPVASGSVAEFEGLGVTVTVPDNSASLFSARAVNDEGISGPCSEPFTYIEDSTPGSVALRSVDPSRPANQNFPRVRGAAGADETVQVFADASCQGPIAGTGSASELAGAGVPVRVPDNATISISARAVDMAGNISACSSPLSYTEDSTPPDTRIVAGPKGETTNRTPAFRLHVSEPGSFPLCKLDGNPPKRCLVFYRTERLSFGRHHISIAAVDPAGNVDPTPATRSWKVVRAKRHRH